MNNRKPMLDVLQGREPAHIPVWLMRQAGRYLPEYRSLRATAGSFLTMALTPALATEITLQPLHRFDLDAAILFADILLVPMALGSNLEFREGEGPVLQTTTTNNIDNLKYDPEKVGSVFEAIRRVKAALPAPKTLIGFCGAPWTVACYMIDGNSKNNFAVAKSWVKEQPQLLQQLIEVLIDASENYLSSQIEAGAEVLQIFDSWAGLIAGDDFHSYVIAPTRELVSRIKRKYPHIPLIGFPREANESDYAAYIRETGVDAMSIDHGLDLQFAKRDLQIIKPLQGNLDPALLVQGGIAMTDQLNVIFSTFGKKHIANLGHGVVPQTPPDHVAQMVEHIHRFGI